MTNYIARGRQVVLPLTNKSAGSVAAGDTVILSSGTAAAFTTTTSAGQTDDFVGVVYDATIAQDATGLVIVQGFVPLITLSSSASLGDYVKTHSVAKQSAPSATRGSGSFGQVLGTGTTPAAFIWGFPDPATAAGNVATDAIWDAAGDLAVGTGADTAGRLAKGNAGGYLAMGNGAVIWNAGTSFPGSKATGDRYFRTDLGLEFYWNGTYWLTTQEYLAGWTARLLMGIAAAGGGGNVAHFAVDSALDPYITTAICVSYVVTTNDGTRYWTMAIYKVPPTGAATSIGSANTSADAADTNVVHTIAINATFSRTGFSQVIFSVNPTGSTPGTLYAACTLKYRLIGT